MNQETRMKNKKRGFTLVELIVSISIFAMMTALVVAKYGNFNQSVLLTNLAYDVALTFRTAQTYGLSVRGSDGTSDPSSFQYAYGLHFVVDTNSFIFFVDRDENGMYTDDTEKINEYTLKRGAYFRGLCADADLSNCTNVAENDLDVTFKRPDPNAHICLNECSTQNHPGALITIRGTDGSTRSVIIRKNGQISVIH